MITDPLSRRRLLGGALAATTALALPWPSAAGEPSLHALAQARGMRFGTAVGTGGADALARSFDDPQVRALVLRECGLLVAENAMKWSVLRPDPERFATERADRLAGFAAENGLAMRGHTLLWHHPQWIPDWVSTHDFGNHPAREAERLLTGHIDRLCARYPHLISWDVINETVDPATGALRETVFTRHLGPAVIDIAFHAARQAAPGAQLAYNDYMSWGAGNETHRAGVLRLLEGLLKRGVPVDALGIQGHIGAAIEDAPGSFGTAREKAWRRFLEAVTGMGLDLLVTELDVHDKGLPAEAGPRDGRVADHARAFLDVTLATGRVTDVLTWGLVDRYSWLQGRWPRPDGLAKRPLPFDDAYQPKPLRGAIAAAFRAAPMQAGTARPGQPPQRREGGTP